MRERSKTEKVYLSLSLLVSLCILPFAFIRYFSGEIILAIIDGTVSLTLLTFFLYVFFTRKIHTAKYAFAIFLAIASLATIAIKGQSQVLWIAPTIIAIHYLIPIKPAGIINTSFLLIMLIILYPLTNFIEYTTIIFTSGLTAVLSFAMFRSYHHKQDELSHLATIDPLTDSGNRRSLEAKLSEVIYSMGRAQHSACLLILDLDGFKGINDKYGHAIGDDILISVCKLVKSNTRVSDSLFRYGGDEFIIAPLTMDFATAKKLGEKIRDIIAKHDFINGIQLTLSIGVAQYQEHDTPEAWISRADVSLYKAKNNGRNKVC